jgi:hypothetical protein
MDSLVSTVVTLMPILGVPAFVAYKHPAAYRTLYVPIYLTACAAYIALHAWDAGTSYTWDTVRPFIDPAKLNDAKAAADALTVLTWQRQLGWACLSIYVLFLAVLEPLGIVADATKKSPASNEPSRAP